jgi:uncharacterized protein with PIN domain
VYKFLLTKELGRLAKWLRILGFDAEYFRQDNTSSLIIQALREDRVILTRNHRLPQGRGVKIILINAETIKAQLAETLKKLNLSPSEQEMFTRCIICNEELVAVEKDKIKEKVPAYVFKTQEDFIRCPKCQRIYWQGTHWGNVRHCLEEIQSNA